MEFKVALGLTVDQFKKENWTRVPVLNEKREELGEGTIEAVDGKIFMIVRIYSSHVKEYMSALLNGKLFTAVDIPFDGNGTVSIKTNGIDGA